MTQLIVPLIFNVFVGIQILLANSPFNKVTFNRPRICSTSPSCMKPENSFIIWPVCHSSFDRHCLSTAFLQDDFSNTMLVTELIFKALGCRGQSGVHQGRPEK